MASTTTNYGFDVPTSSDLVKNGATAISTLGQDLDTFLFRPFTRNGILNGSFNVWQRGTSFAISGTQAYTADRWQGRTTSAVTSNFSRQLTNDTTNLPNIQYAMRVQRASGQTATPLMIIEQSWESVNSIPYAGKIITMSFYARAGANFSSASSGLVSQLREGTGTDQNIAAGYTGSSAVINQTITLTTTWQRFTFTGTVASNSTELGLQFYYTATGTAGASDYFEITGVMIEIGNQASPYAPATPTYATELAACQRYYYRTTSTVSYQMLSSFGTGKGTTQGLVDVKVPSTMRTIPTSVDFANVALYDYTNAALAITALTVDAYATPNDPFLLATVASGVTALRAYGIVANGTVGAYVGVSAEL